MKLFLGGLDHVRELPSTSQLGHLTRGHARSLKKKRRNLYIRRQRTRGATHIAFFFFFNREEEEEEV